MVINIIIEDDYKKKISRRLLRWVAEQVLNAEKTGNNTELGVLITTQEKVHELNRTYRKIDRPTDVLSFYMIPESAGGKSEIFINPPDNLRHLGEVIISYPQAVIQAKENSHPADQEITVLLVHGILHLLGYDHEKTEDEERMKPRETAILKSMDIAES